MARHWFGETPADVVVAPGDQVEVQALLGYHAVLAPGVVLHCYDYETGDRLLDLLDSTGTPVTTVTTSSDGRIPRFRGPDGVERMLIGQDPATLPPEADPAAHRWTIMTTSYPDIVDGLRQRIAALEADSGGEYVSSAHPLLWSARGEVETHVSDHTVANLDGRDQTVSAIRASATAFAANTVATVTVYTVDLDTSTRTSREVLVLDIGTPALTVTPSWVVPDGQGLTVGVEVAGTPPEHLTVQVMVK